MTLQTETITKLRNTGLPTSQISLQRTEEPIVVFLAGHWGNGKTWGMIQFLLSTQNPLSEVKVILSETGAQRIHVDQSKIPPGIYNQVLRDCACCGSNTEMAAQITKFLADKNTPCRIILVESAGVSYLRPQMEVAEDLGLKHIAFNFIRLGRPAATNFDGERISAADCNLVTCTESYRNGRIVAAASGQVDEYLKFLNRKGSKNTMVSTLSTPFPLEQWSELVSAPVAKRKGPPTLSLAMHTKVPMEKRAVDPKKDAVEITYFHGIEGAHEGILRPILEEIGDYFSRSSAAKHVAIRISGFVGNLSVDFTAESGTPFAIDFGTHRHHANDSKLGSNQFVVRGLNCNPLVGPYARNFLKVGFPDAGMSFDEIRTGYPDSKFVISPNAEPVPPIFDGDKILFTLADAAIVLSEENNAQGSYLAELMEWAEKQGDPYTSVFFEALNAFGSNYATLLCHAMNVRLDYLEELGKLRTSTSLIENHHVSIWRLSRSLCQLYALGLTTIPGFHENNEYADMLARFAKLSPHAFVLDSIPHVRQLVEFRDIRDALGNTKVRGINIFAVFYRDVSATVRGKIQAAQGHLKGLIAANPAVSVGTDFDDFLDVG